MALTRKDFGDNPHAGANRNNAASRGWGRGWPNCSSSKMRIAAGGGVRITVRQEIVELVETLLDATAAMGYRLIPGQCWGYACRAIRGSNVASNHSWGLAVDINSLANPMQTRFKTDIPPRVVKMWEACGFYWGGRYVNRPDAMHFERLGTPDDVAADLKKAKGFLAAARGETKPAPKPEPDKPTSTKDVKLGDRVLRLGMSGADVALLQRFLGRDAEGNRLVADGQYGPKTQAAVRAYQKMRGLAVDGIAGPKTLGPIIEAVGGKS